MSTLFELTEEMRLLAEILSDFDGDVSESEKEAEIDKLFEQILANEASFEKKVDSYVYLMNEFATRAEARKREAERLKILANRDEAEKNRLFDRLSEHLRRAGKTDFETTLHRFKFTKAGGKQAVWIDEQVENEDYLACILDEYKKTIPARLVIDKDKVREALEAGYDLSFAKLLPRKETLKIK